MNKKRFLKIRLIFAIIRDRAVIANAIFKGGFTLLSEDGYITNCKCEKVN